MPRDDESLEVTVARIDFNTMALKEELIGAPGRQGRIPSLEREIIEHGDRDNQQFAAISQQLSYWKGALALIAVMCVAFGGVLLAHILGGK